MRNLLQLLASFALLAAQAISPQAKLAASAQVPTSAAELHLEVSINSNQSDPLIIKAPVRPNFDADVLTPLRAAQAKAAAEANVRAQAQAKAQAEAAARIAAEAAARKVVPSSIARTTTVARASSGMAPATPENMQALRYCEAGGIYSRNSGNGYYGAYQFDIGTWGGWGGYARADLAPASVQDQKFLETYARRGWAPWPSCSRKLGLM